MKAIEINKVNETDRISGNELILIPFGDLHIGAETANIEKIKDTIEWIKSKPNVRVILMGDILNVGTKASIGGGTFDDIMTPQEQYELALDLLRPIKNKIYGCHIGNHEDNRIRASTSINLTLNMCRELGFKFFGYGVFHKIRFGKHNYIVYSCHGSSGAKLAHTKLKPCIDLASSFKADLYLMGHVHELDLHTDLCYELDMRHAKPVAKKRYFVLTGHFMDYKGSYAEAKQMRPGKQGVPKIKLFKDRKDIHVSI